MGKKVLIFVIIAMGIALLIYYGKYMAGKGGEKESDVLKAQADLIKQKAEADAACKKNWLCASSELLSKAGQIL